MHCGNCHGVAAVSLGILPDLRFSPAVASAEDWRNIVLGGALEDGGMAAFSQVLDADAAEAVRAFVVARVNESQ
jgi:mono/diheme cytochrome c family protein